jgi:hypothetical protein
MLPYMKPSNTMWGRVLACCLAVGGTLGFWAGGAAAQSEDPGGWFDGSAPPQSGPPQEDARGAPPGEPDYSPPPPDFQPAPAAPPPADDAVSGDTGDDSDRDGAAQQRAVQEFSPQLEPYGRWVEDPWYGRVWVPSRSVVGGEFVPYSTGGHWELTPDDAWLWASDYPFGSITFHYGRWVWASGGSWAWVPGYAYAPAWVDFRVGAAGYIGWAPLGPSYVWRHGAFVSVGLWRPAPVVYCPTQYVFVRTMPRYIVRDSVRVRSISAQTHVYRPVRYLGGGRVTYLARGPSPREARIPASALPARRVVAQPRLAPWSGAQRTRIESSRFPDNRGPSVRSRSYDAYRAPALPQRSNPDVRRPGPRSGWNSAPARGFERPERRERSVSPGTGYPGGPPAMHRGGYQRAAPQREVPQRAAPQHAVPYTYNRAPVGVPRERAAPGRVPYAAAPAAPAPRAARPEADTRGSRRGKSRSDNGSGGDSRARGPYRSGAWR